MSQHPLKYCFMFNCSVGLQRQDEDFVVELDYRLVLRAQGLRVEIPGQDQSSEDDEIGNADVQLELTPIPISLVRY
jgi:hypothetical protein